MKQECKNNFINPFATSGTESMNLNTSILAQKFLPYLITIFQRLNKSKITL